MQPLNQSNDLIHPTGLQALAEVMTGDGPVFSLYLDLRSADPLGRFEALLEEAARQKKLDLEPRAYQEHWARDAARIRDWLAAGVLQVGEAEGLALFASDAAGLWRVYRLPAPVIDRLAARDTPHVRPLEILLNERPCVMVLLADDGTARLAVVRPGGVEEVDRLEAVPVTGAGPEEFLSQHARAALELVEAAWPEHGCGYLVTGGSPEMLEALRDAVRQTRVEGLLDAVVGETALTPEATHEAILAEVREVVEAQEQQLEARRVEALLAGAGPAAGVSTTAAPGAASPGAPAPAEGSTAPATPTGPAVLGLEQALLSVRNQKARLLVVDQDLHPAGGECPNCGFLGEGQEGICLLCGMALRPEPDLCEAALKRVIEQGGSIDILRSPEARHALEPHGGIGALLYDLPDTPTVRDVANRRIIARGGQINRDALHDEAVEQSFPASDPPGW